MARTRLGISRMSTIPQTPSTARTGHFSQPGMVHQPRASNTSGASTISSVMAQPVVPVMSFTVMYFSSTRVHSTPSGSMASECSMGLRSIVLVQLAVLDMLALVRGQAAQ